jgi:hypothetical protein
MPCALKIVNAYGIGSTVASLREALLSCLKSDARRGGGGASEFVAKVTADLQTSGSEVLSAFACYILVGRSDRWLASTTVQFVLYVRFVELGTARASHQPSVDTGETCCRKTPQDSSSAEIQKDNEQRTPCMSETSHTVAYNWMVLASPISVSHPPQHLNTYLLERWSMVRWRPYH